MVADSDLSPLPARRLAERLRDFRERKRLTQRQLATAIGGADAHDELAETGARW